MQLKVLIIGHGGSEKLTFIAIGVDCYTCNKEFRLDYYQNNRARLISPRDRCSWDKNP